MIFKNVNTFLPNWSVRLTLGASAAPLHAREITIDCSNKLLCHSYKKTFSLFCSKANFFIIFSNDITNTSLKHSVLLWL